jgi:flagellar assembly factor FliW
MNEPSSRVISPVLGEIRWDTDCELHFPAGLPGFERHKRMVPVEIPSQRPLVYLQSAERGEVCFLALPVLTVHSGFRLRLSEEDRSLLELDQSEATRDDTPAIGADVLCLALLVPVGGTFQTNLDAPIVINLHNGRGIQIVTPAAAAGSWRLSRSGAWEAVC